MRRLKGKSIPAAVPVRLSALWRKPLDYHTIHDEYGVLSPVSHLTADQKRVITNARNYRRRSEIALDVASNYPGGDYFEFGSVGLGSFRSFVAAFDLYGLAERFPESRFYAFDIFGDPDQGSGPPADERAYFEHWRHTFEAAAPLHHVKEYGPISDRCVLVNGYFQDTLNEEFKAMMRRENRKIGFAFLDCNIASSYKLVFDFLLDVMRPERMFIAMDEYFEDHSPAIHTLYEEFAAKAKKRYGLDSLYMRNAGAYDGLFCLMPRG